MASIDGIVKGFAPLTLVQLTAHLVYSLLPLLDCTILTIYCAFQVFDRLLMLQKSALLRLYLALKIVFFISYAILLLD